MRSDKTILDVVTRGVTQEQQIVGWLLKDPMRMGALEIAASLNLTDWCLSAGFVRNLVWDHLHGYSETTPLNDIDLIYFDSTQISRERDEQLEVDLTEKANLPWSVKNQARMHTRNADKPYRSTSHAMMHWVEVETAVGAYLSETGEVQLVAPFGVSSLMAGEITLNSVRAKPDDFKRRLQDKRWLELWPNLRLGRG